jgi:branched-chain amino acid transport system substrate-binding protein
MNDSSDQRHATASNPGEQMALRLRRSIACRCTVRIVIGRIVIGLLLAIIQTPCHFYTAHAQPVKDIVLGIATTLSYLEGRESHEAIQLAVAEINAAGGVAMGTMRLPLRIETIDLDDAKPDVTVAQALERLEAFIASKKVHAVLVGPFRSEILLAGIDIFARHKIPLLGSIAMSPALETKILADPRYKYIFRVCLNAKYLVEYLIDTMKFLRLQYGFDKVYIMHQDVVWTKTAASLMVKLYFDRSDWHIVGLDQYSYGTTDFSPGLVKAEEGGAQVVLALFDMAESSMLVKQWNRLGGDALLFGFISPLAGPGAWRTFGDNIAGTLNVIFELGNIPSSRWPPSTAFYESFARTFGRPIEAGHGPAPAYESVYILAEAVQRAGSLDADELVAALEATDRMGVMGRIRFHRGHQVVFGNDLSNEALACIIQWGQDGRRRIVYPLSIAEGEIELPSRRP